MVSPYLSSGILPPSDYGKTIKSLHTKAVSNCKSLLSHNHVLQTASLQIAPEEPNVSMPYSTVLSQLRSSFCSFLYSYRERIERIPSPSCRIESHTTDHVFSCSSHPTPLTELDAWERPRLESEFSSVLPKLRAIIILTEHFLMSCRGGYLPILYACSAIYVAILTEHFLMSCRGGYLPIL